MRGLDQGTLLSNVRSSKYPGIRCFGVVITASCDIANTNGSSSKVSKLYYLVAVEVKKWLSVGVAYDLVYKEKKNNLLQTVNNCAENCGLRAGDLLRMDSTDADKVISGCGAGSKKIRQLNDSIQNYALFCREGMSDDDRKEAIKKDMDTAVRFLEKITKGEALHYYFLPEIAYKLEGGQKSRGLIVDLQEIESISIQDASRIPSPGIDRQLFSEYSEEECKRYGDSFWLEQEDDYVDCDTVIQSPWREHLMQRFSHDFSRIGLDGPSKTDYKALVDGI